MMRSLSNVSFTMTRLELERNQVWLYLAAIVAGLILGSFALGVAPIFERILWPVLAVLLFATFLQTPLLHVRDAFRDGRFMLASVLGNFVFVPLLVWGLLCVTPGDPALKLGVALVLLAPCTDWFVTFSQLGRGHAASAVAVTPFNLLAQLLLLPLYLWWLVPGTFGGEIVAGDILPAAIALIGVPLVAAALGERWIEARAERAIWRERAAWTPVPLLAVVVFLIAGAQINVVADAWPHLPRLTLIFVVFLIAVALLARVLAAGFKLTIDRGRTLVFSLGTRNSFVVLPIALALPQGWELAVVAIVFQSLVELFGMVLYLWWIPNRLFADHRY